MITKIKSIIICLLIMPVFLTGEPTLRYNFYQNPSFFENSLAVILHATDFPKNKQLELKSQRMDGSTELSQKVYINEENLLVLPSKEIFLVLFKDKYGNGEPVTMKLSTKNKRQSASVMIIPRPINAEDSSGHILALKMVDFSGTVFLAVANGFEPNEKVKICSESCGEKIETFTNASASGFVSFSSSPATMKEVSGDASLEIIGKNTKDLKVYYKWGMAAFDFCR